jgi:hypothetical protein
MQSVVFVHCTISRRHVLYHIRLGSHLDCALVPSVKCLLLLTLWSKQKLVSPHDGLKQCTVKRGNLRRNLKIAFGDTEL